MLQALSIYLLPNLLLYGANHINLLTPPVEVIAPFTNILACILAYHVTPHRRDK
jgi:hypothetical protein